MYRRDPKATDNFMVRAMDRISGLPDRLLLGLSGGADSVCLLHLLLKCGKYVKAVHCNFNLRGEESSRDQNFCIDLCRDLNVSLDIIQFDALKTAAERGISVEMACRDLRYGKFFQLMSDYHCERLVVAHHADDNIETIFLNLMRGCGLSGLSGMSPDNGQIARPLLEFHRKDIEKYLESLGIPYITDSSNMKNDIRRNFIRNEVIPLLETRWPSVRKSVSLTINHLREAEKIYLDATLPSTPYAIPVDLLRKSSSPGILLHEFLKNTGLGSKTEPEVLLAVKSGKNGQTWKTSKGFLWKGTEKLCFIPEEFLTNGYPAADFSIVTSPDIKSDRGNDIAYLSGKKEDYCWKRCDIRDSVSPLNMSGKKTIKEVLKEAGIPSPLRHNIWGLHKNSTGEPVWIPGIRRFSGDHVTEDKAEQRILCIRLLSAPYYQDYLKK